MTTEEKTILPRILLDYREKLITQADRDGLSLQDIGDLFGISRARVHQIIINYRARQLK